MEIDSKMVGKFLLNGYTGCWEWQCVNKAGYGIIKIGRKSFRAHRYSWGVKNGLIPDKMEICHKCDNPRCVNPEHLFLGTHQENMMDAYKKNRIRIPVSSFRFFHSDPAVIVALRAYWKSNPNASLRQAAQACKCSPTTAGKYKP